LKRPATLDEVKAVWREFGADMAGLGLPSAPHHLIAIREDPYRPQVRLDRDEEGGMSTVVGRLREDPALPNGIKYVLVSHNTRMGAAKGAILVSEYLTKRGLIK
jgi:aspartate-semialdehyde dehydrogenase